MLSKFAFELISSKTSPEDISFNFAFLIFAKPFEVIVLKLLFKYISALAVPSVYIESKLYFKLNILHSAEAIFFKSKRLISFEFNLSSINLFLE